VTRFFSPCRAIRAILRLSVGNDANDEPKEIAMNAIQTIEQFKSDAASFLATVETLTNMRTVREMFAPLNTAICGGITVPPALWSTCDAVIAAYQQAASRLHRTPRS
jgi:hypothetical protein